MDFTVHQEFHSCMTALKRFYLEHPAFWEKDYDPEGFVWLECGAEEQCVYAFERRGEKERIAAVFNFSGVEQTGLCLRITGAAKLEEIFSSGNCISTEEKGTERKKSVTGRFELELAPFLAEYYLIK